MPLSPPSPRRHYHTRDIQVQGYYREDGLWDIEGHMRDIKTYSFHMRSRDATLEPGDPIHDMWIRMTIDDDFRVHAIEAVSDATPFGICGSIAEAYQCLVGLQIGPGWTRAIRDRLGKIQGCTHLSELLGPIATVAYQTAYASRQRAYADAGKSLPARDPNKPARKPAQLDSCHALRSDSPVVKEFWPEFYEEKTALTAPEDQG